MASGPLPDKARDRAGRARPSPGTRRWACRGDHAGRRWAGRPGEQQPGETPRRHRWLVTVQPTLPRAARSTPTRRTAPGRRRRTDQVTIVDGGRAGVYRSASARQKTTRSRARRRNA